MARDAAFFISAVMGCTIFMSPSWYGGLIGKVSKDGSIANAEFSHMGGTEVVMIGGPAEHVQMHSALLHRNQVRDGKAARPS